jgi:peroxiredoxin
VYQIGTAAPEAEAVDWLKDWRLVHAPEPVIPEPGGEASSLLGKPAKTFKLPLLGGGEFDLEKEKGNIVILDFWASWCAPCVKALPELIEAMSQFPPERVKLVAINQGEPAEQVKKFIEGRGWQLAVATDPAQAVAPQYGVEAFPHTVIVGPDGNVAWVKSGYTPDGDIEAAEAVKELLSKLGNR